MNIVESTYTTVNENRKGQITSTSDYITKTTVKESQIKDVTGTSPVPWFSKYSVSMTIYIIGFLVVVSTTARC